jgi:hypothetical protein
MPSQRSRPPVPIIGAVALILVAAVVLLVSAVVLTLTFAPIFLGLAVGALLPAMIAHGLWRGLRGSQIVAVLLGLALVSLGLSDFRSGVAGLIFAGYGLVISLLVVVPPSSRAWFGR